MSRPTANKVVKIAISQIGVCESPSGSNRQKYGSAYGMNGVPWCAEFVWWCGWKAAGKKQSSNPIAKSASAAYVHEETVKKGGKWVMKKNRSAAERKKYLKKAKPGDIVSFDFGAFDGVRDHVGIVEGVSGKYLICIEGNTSKSGSQSNGGMVVRQRRLYTSVCAATRPKYEGEDKGRYDGVIPTKTIEKGDKGDQVRYLQNFLNWALQGAWETEKYSKLIADGEAGGKTMDAVKLFRDIHHLSDKAIFSKTCREIAKEMKMTEAQKAVNWAVATARDNTFMYGTGSRAHNYGCYYCGTNITGKKKAKKGSKWEKTYCCNPFVHAAFAHGTKNKRMLSACKGGGGGGTSPGTWTRYGCWKKVGKCKNVPFSKLKVGDIIMKSQHVWIYTGEDGIVEAGASGFSASSIKHKNGAKKRYSDYKKLSSGYVCRYKG